jgi:hypothetical protein
MPTSRRIVNFASAPENPRCGVDSVVVGRDPDSGLRNLIVRRKNRSPLLQKVRQPVDAKGYGLGLIHNVLPVGTKSLLAK